MNPVSNRGEPWISTVVTMGVDKSILDIISRKLNGLLRWEEWAEDSAAKSKHPDQLLQSDAVLIGPQLDNPVQVAQRVYRVDKTIPVLILSPADRIADLERSIIFSPYLGSEVRPWSVTDVDRLASALQIAVERRRQRSSYVHTIQSAQVHLGKLSLFQPEVTHYLDRLLDRLPVGVLSVDALGRILSMSRRAEAILYANEADLLGKNVKSFFPVAEHKKLSHLLKIESRTETRPPTIFQVISQDRETRHVEATAAPLAYHAGQRGAMLILQEVTERVRAERERARAESDLRSHVEVLSAFHRISSAQNIRFNEKVQQLLEFGCAHLDLPFGLVTRIESGALHIVRAVFPGDAINQNETMRLASSYCEATIRRQDPLSIEFSDKESGISPKIGGETIEAYLGARIIVRSSVYGTIFFAGPHPRLKPFTSSERETLKLMSLWIGGQLESELNEAHMRTLSSALEQAADSVAITDKEGVILHVNRAYETLTGYSKEEVIGRKMSVLRSGVHDDTFYKQLWDTVKRGDVFRGILVNRRKDGCTYYEDKTITSLRDNNGAITHFVSTGHDVTERRKAEESTRRHQAEMAHVARLSTLGEMTSGLAHELTQPLCAITTYAQTCLRIANEETLDVERIRYGLQQVIKQAELGGAIFLRLRKFGRKGEVSFRRTNVRDVIREAISLIGADLTQSEVTLRLDEEEAWPPPVRVDPIQIEQVILNLVRNSIDAMQVVKPASRQLAIRVSKPCNDVVKVSIADSGRGCPTALAERLFEPFFTTKQNGLGIGLSISQSIIEAHGGRLWIEENGSTGATFSFTLPLCPHEHHSSAETEVK